MHNVNKDPRPPFELPAAYSTKAPPDAADPGAFWLRLNEPELTSLIDQALAHNLQLRQGWARLEQARAGSRGAMAGLFPRIDSNLSASRSASPPRIFPDGMGGTREIPSVESDNFSISAPVSYELDVWGRVRSGMFAADQDVVAFRADVEAIAMTIAATVTERWFDVIEQRATRKLIEEQMAVSERTLSLVRLRFEDNNATLSDIYQQQQQIQGMQSRLTQVAVGERLAETQLALLLGTPARKFIDPARLALPDPPPLPEVGIPASLLEMRPDVRAAKARAIAADYRVAQAIAARMPRFKLSANIGFSSPSLSTLFESFIWSLGASMGTNIFDGGQAYAAIDRSRAAVDERVAAYGQTMLQAIVEVESALARERQQEKRIQLLELQTQTSERALEAARRRFAAGIGSYLSTLTALRSLQGAQQTLLNARRQLLSQRVQVYRAMGSRWTTQLTPPQDRNTDASPQRGTRAEDKR